MLGSVRSKRDQLEIPHNQPFQSEKLYNGRVSSTIRILNSKLHYYIKLPISPEAGEKWPNDSPKNSVPSSNISFVIGTRKRFEKFSAPGLI